MKKTIIARRQVLRGLGGVTVGLPFLPSLVPVKAYAAEVTFPRVRRFVAITTEHGGIAWPNMFPGNGALTETQELFPGFIARSGALKPTLEGTDAVLSPVLRAPASLLTPRMIARMNVLRGLDAPFDLSHHTGGHLGNFSASGGETSTVPALPTIDQVMAYSPGFYRDLAAVQERVMYCGRQGLSHNHSVPSRRSGSIQALRPASTARQLFDRVFPSQAGGPLGQKPIVDRILERYRQLRTRNPRLSAADRQRLDDHVERLADLERKLAARERLACPAPPRAPAGDLSGSTNGRPDLTAQHYAAITDVVAAAFACGVSRIAVIGVAETFAPVTGDWHQDYAHQWSVPEKQKVLSEAVQRVFQSVFLELARKLDVEESPGVTYLDDSLVQWTQECGWSTHHSWSLPVVTVGGAGGALRTGLYCDYQNMNPRAVLIPARSRFGDEAIHSGLTYQRYLATVLEAMGVKRSEFQREGMYGYGAHHVGSTFAKTHVRGVVESADRPLPFIGRSS